MHGDNFITRKVIYPQYNVSPRRIFYEEDISVTPAVGADNSNTPLVTDAPVLHAVGLDASIPRLVGVPGWHILDVITDVIRSGSAIRTDRLDTQRGRILL